MKKQIAYVGLCLMLSAAMVNCAKKQVSQTSGSTQDQSTTTTTTTTTTATSSPSEAVDYNIYAGKYKMQSDQVGTITVTVENNRVYGQAEGQPKTEIKPEGKDSFDVPEFGAKVVFNRDSNQKVNGVTLFINGGEVSGDKIE